MRKLKQNSRSVRDVALGLLSRREHSVLELGRKLKSKGYSSQEIEQTLDQLQDEKLLSDARFTESYIHMRQQKGYGPLRIAAELRERGIAADLIECHLDTGNRDWQQLLHQQYRKKYGNSLPDSYEEKARRVKYLQNRGFAIDWILTNFSGLAVDNEVQVYDD